MVNGQHIAESKSIHVVLGDLACVISFNIHHNVKNTYVLVVPWFELHNLDVDWGKTSKEHGLVSSQRNWTEPFI